MKWVSALSDHRFLKYAVAECAHEMLDALGDVKPDLIIAFVSSHHAARYDELPELVNEFFGEAFLTGCSGGGVIGAGREAEDRPGLSLTAASLPDVIIRGIHVENSEMPDGDAPPLEWEKLLDVKAADDPQFLILSDPFSIEGEKLIMGLDYAFPRGAKIGGLASGGHQPESNAIYISHNTYDYGASVLSLRGDIAVDTIVAQGCRPIGQRMQITSCERNMLYQLDGRDIFEVLREMFQQLNERDQRLAQSSLFLGVVMDEFKDDPQLGDFLIRNILGVDAQGGALAVGEILKEGQTAQFHLRDAETSSQDLNEMLTQYSEDRTPGAGAGALLFQCLGRGSYLYGRPDHDTDMFRDKVGDLPLSGFFCNGEIGQVSGSTYLHGYTSSFGIFRPKTPLIPNL